MSGGIAVGDVVGGLDLGRLRAWLVRRGLGERISDARVLSGGSQNVVLDLRIDGVPFVLRHPPLHARAHSDRAIAREMRVLGALAGRGLPVPELFAGSEDPGVLGGAFYLMTRIEGFNPAVELPDAYRVDADLPRRAGGSVAIQLARLGALDPAAVGLGDIGAPEGFLRRQIDNALRLWSTFREDDGYDASWLGDVGNCARWLVATLPAASRPGIVHGDYQLNNVLLGRDVPEVTGILDWEMVTIGDPLLDLAWLLICWPPSPVPSGGELARRPTLPTRRELLASYAAHGDRDVSGIDWYVALACVKWAVLFETTHLRARAGRTAEATGRAAHDAARALMSTARDIAAGRTDVLDGGGSA
jgi:aminoglycoside phosphotransferase (APT) family kinase protein